MRYLQIRDVQEYEQEDTIPMNTFSDIFKKGFLEETGNLTTQGICTVHACGADLRHDRIRRLSKLL